MTNARRKCKPVTIKIVGLILAESYQRCRLFAERLHKHHERKFLAPSITGLLDMDWVDYIHKLRKRIGGKTWAVKDSVVVFLDDSFLGGEEELFQHFKNFLYKNPSKEKIKEYAEKEYVSYLNKGNLLYTFIELSQDGDYMGTLLFQLRYDLLPKTSLWFTEFCTHVRYSYKGTKIPRICKNGWFQSGNIYCQKQWSLRSLDDENLSYKHDRRGILSFANKGKHSNKFQFFVTFQPAEWMDGRYVAFGRVIEGSDVLRRLENTPCTYEAPDVKIIIKNCGLAKVGLGRVLDPSLRVKGITVGTPHIHVEVFVDMIFDWFNNALYERLEQEQKKQIEEGNWIWTSIWEKVEEVLTKKRPLEDMLDVRDGSSRTYLIERYNAGLYSLPEIPDLYIISLLNEAIQKAVDQNDTKMMAKSVVDFLVDLALDEATMTDELAGGIVNILVMRVLNMIFGVATSTVSINDPADEDRSKSLAEFAKRAGLNEEDMRPSKEQMSSKRSISSFVLGLILGIVQNINQE